MEPGSMTCWIRLAGVAVLFCAVGIAQEAAAQTKARGWNGDAEAAAPTMESLIPELQDEESYSERYTFDVRFDDGGSAKFEFTISNFGWGSGHGVADVRVDLPERPVYEFTRKLNRGEWSFARDRFQLSIAETKVEGVDERTFRLTHEGDIDVALTFENTLPMWQPGRGKVTSGGKFFTQELIAPRANVRGRIEADGTVYEVRGTRTGFADHSATQFAPYNLARRFSRFHDFNDDVFVAWREVGMTEKRGGASYTWLVVGYKDQIVFSDPAAELVFEEARVDPETGYRIPKLVTLEGRSGADRVSLKIRAENPRRKSLLEEFGGLVRTLAKAVTDPYQYAFDGDYELRMTIEGATATVRGTARFSIDYLN